MNLRIRILPHQLAVCRLAPETPLPSWVRGAFTSVTRTRHELSIVCDDDAVPPGINAERNWRAFMVEGPIPFEMTGVAASLIAPLAEARISVFVIATFDTDYVLVKSPKFEQASEIFRAAGHEVT